MKILLKPKNVAEAIATYNLLEDNSIHAVIQSCHDTAYDLISQTGNPQTSNIETVRLLMEFFADELEIFIRFKSLS